MEKKIAIKSTKFFGNLLLLETKDWDENGRYIPNIDSNCSEYDYFVLIRVRPECSNIMKRNRWYYTNHLDYEVLWPAITNETWSANLVGFITRDELIKSVIKTKQILPQNANLNGTTKMDADNYYVQAGDMNSISELIKVIKSKKY